MHDQEMDADDLPEGAGKMWERTPGDWTCPICGRAKIDLVRPAKSGKVAGKLVEHHDHIELFLREKRREIQQETEVEPTPGYWEFHEKKLRPFIRRFERILVCEDCNNADASAKAIVGAERYFSFSPTEISAFIRPSPNQNHSLDKTLVRDVYITALVKHEYCKELAVVLMHRALSGRIWGEKPLGPPRNHYIFMDQYDLHPDEVWSFEEMSAVWTTIPDKNLSRVRNAVAKMHRRTKRRAERKNKSPK
jgi:rubredoxin